MSKIVNCETCNKELIRNKSQIKASKSGLFFCDRECKSMWHAKQFKIKRENNENRVPFECPVCSKIIMMLPTKMKNRKTCSMECTNKYRSNRGKTEIKCDWCGDNFVKLNSKIKNNNFCTRKCSDEWNANKKSTRITKICIICDNEFRVVPSRIKTAKTCSIKCHYKHITNISNGDGIMVKQLKSNGVKTVANQKKSGTKPEIITEKCLIDLGINFEPQFPMYDKFVVDFYLPDYDTVLEVYGDYWHNNPEVYGEGLINPNKFQLSQSKKDKSKEGYLKKCGHKFIHIWEKDIYNNVEKEIREKIL